ncbi:hypothetical protein DACRYDRAFT_55300 [Dacryopinax primogenitus]|uniref:SURF1-like protein n=1 Tax=Dacryopinax primogenitus (strain DJM 731) TaxID=1858805 RepID=M5G8B3_DACPD|nr:uncharacterized protein DACRYDRAFT_55300 [Dacryopinax primogenitus]EJT99997.1 hypothetical protein DACRYDRAFT_55300 [Dacryopinax primogenitus]
MFFWVFWYSYPPHKQQQRDPQWDNRQPECILPQTVIIHSSRSSQSSSSSLTTTLSQSNSYIPPPPPPPRKPTFTARLRSSPAAMLLGIIPLLTLGLGFWQVYRLRWKLALIDELEDKLGREALWLPGRINVDKLPEFQYRRVLAQGTYLPSQTIYVGPRTYDGVHGYHAITPLARPGGSTIFINRGFVPKDFCPGGPKYAGSPLALERTGGEVTIEGLLRQSSTRGTFVPENEPEKGVYYWVDLPLLSERMGESAQPVLVDEVYEGHLGLVAEKLARGEPVGRKAKVEMRNQHAVYAATWCVPDWVNLSGTDGL